MSRAIFAHISDGSGLDRSGVDSVFVFDQASATLYARHCVMQAADGVAARLSRHHSEPTSERGIRMQLTPIAIVGVGETRPTRRSEKGIRALVVEAIQAALPCIAISARRARDYAAEGLLTNCAPKRFSHASCRPMRRRRRLKLPTGWCAIRSNVSPVSRCGVDRISAHATDDVHAKAAQGGDLRRVRSACPSE